MSARRPGRPTGEIALALLAAAASGPGTVRELAARSLVGLPYAYCTSTRLVQRGQLHVIEDGRPRVLGLPTPESDGAAALDTALRSWWAPPR